MTRQSILIETQANILSDIWVQDGGRDITDEQEKAELMADYQVLMGGETDTTEFQGALVRMRAKEMYAEYSAKQTLTRMMKNG